MFSKAYHCFLFNIFKNNNITTYVMAYCLKFTVYVMIQKCHRKPIDL